jgi:hypothetical protein
MADITQITASDSVTFSANSNAADLWMREHYQRRQICFDLSVISLMLWLS